MTVATLTLARLGTSSVWHIVRSPGTTLCSWEIPDGATVEEGFDPHVIQFKGKPVCVRCRRAVA